MIFLLLIIIPTILALVILGHKTDERKHKTRRLLVALGVFILGLSFPAMAMVLVFSGFVHTYMFVFRLFP